MKVLVLGATGYVGGALVEELAGRGHEVVALVRPAADGGRRLPAVPEERYGDLADAASITAAVTQDVDAVVHAAQLTGDEARDLQVIGALLGTGRPVVYVSGVWVLGATEDGHEESAADPIPIVGYRPKVEDLVLGAGGVVVRPGLVHGRGGGIPVMLRGWAAERGSGVHVGEGGEGSTFVHVDDLAELIVTAVEKGRPGTVYHGVAEEHVPLALVAAAAAGSVGVGEGADVVSWPVAEAAQVVGLPFAEALALSQRVSSARTRAALGWAPSRPGILSELREGSYAR
ncbi:NAD-dependent epimerase/dehydratase family protein [Nonomuraea endophytica]|uniref:Nucleoside-diphosphate-sugar epimerase n=1 Tax=Nonomuraea endophytica TaxID=714136 RepID=A0A7W8EE80_9ACTN|nr:NAD-dependent epimerase/dehydratase family protein [Nonomuraea endophytica]MBB5075057.1 nucleoside-diphosphate-sugar epimerase [Nonomuraea endophytica]